MPLPFLMKPKDVHDFFFSGRDLSGPLAVYGFRNPSLVPEPGRVEFLRRVFGLLFSPVGGKRVVFRLVSILRYFFFLLIYGRLVLN